MSPLYAPDGKIAKMLGHDTKWLRDNADVLERQYGLPPIDPAVGMRHVEAVEEWARERNMRKTERSERLSETNQENFDAL